jgi:hypothetical protein
MNERDVRERKKEKGDREKGEADGSQIIFAFYLFTFTFLKSWQNQPGTLA